MTVTFTGDISITGAFVEKVKTNNEIFSTDILTQIQDNNFVIGNLEGPTTNYNKTINNSTPLKSPTNTINYLKNRNIKIFNLANNHILDYNETGLKDTILNLKKENCEYFGAGITKDKTIAPIILKTDNISIAVFGITKTNPTHLGDATVFSSDDFKVLKTQINLYRKRVDFIIVNFHGGEEYTLFPSPVKRKFLKKIAALKNVDCVIAHHSHTFQGYEKHKNTYIFYSLGNFIFDIPNHNIHDNTKTSALLKLNFSKKNFTFSFIPFDITNGTITKHNSFHFKERVKKLSDFNNYTHKWQQEAFKVLFRKENKKIKSGEDPNSLQKKSFLNLFFSKKFYIKIFRILKDKYMFSLYINAVLYKIKTKNR